MSDDRCPRCRQPLDHANGDGHIFDKTAGRYLCSVGMESDG